MCASVSRWLSQSFPFPAVVNIDVRRPTFSPPLLPLWLLRVGKETLRESRGCTAQTAYLGTGLSTRTHMDGRTANPLHTPAEHTPVITCSNSKTGCSYPAVRAVGWKRENCPTGSVCDFIRQGKVPLCVELKWCICELNSKRSQKRNSTQSECTSTHSSYMIYLATFCQKLHYRCATQPLVMSQAALIPHVNSKLCVSTNSRDGAEGTRLCSTVQTCGRRKKTNRQTQTWTLQVRILGRMNRAIQDILPV